MDKIYIGDVIQKIAGKSRPNSELSRKVSNLTDEQRDFYFQKNQGSKIWNFLLHMKKERVMDLIHSGLPELEGFFSRQINQVDYRLLCEKYNYERSSVSNEEEPLQSTLYVEAAGKGDHTLIDMLPLIFSHLVKVPRGKTRKLTLLNKSSDSLPEAYAFILRMMAAARELSSPADIFDFCYREKERKGRPKDDTDNLTPKGVKWFLDSIDSYVLKNPKPIIKDIADLQPASLTFRDHGEKQEAHVFTCNVPHKLGEQDTKNVIDRFDRIIDDANKENKEERTFEKITLRCDKLREKVCKHLPHDSAKELNKYIKENP